MTPHQTLTVAVRLFVILVALYVLRELLAFSLSGKEGEQRYALMAMIYVPVVLFLVVLWFFPRTIARGLLPLSSDAPAQPATPDTWFAVGSCLIGLWLMASAVPALLRNSLVMYLFRSKSVDLGDLASGLLYYAIQFLVGVGLILAADGIRKLVWRLRNAGSN
jgi:hypothetical protein